MTPDNQPTTRSGSRSSRAATRPGNEEFPAIAHERTRPPACATWTAPSPWPAPNRTRPPADFFICIGDQPELDFGGRRNPDGQGFAAFGRVVKGMDVVRKIQRSPAAGPDADAPRAHPVHQD